MIAAASESTGLVLQIIPVMGTSLARVRLPATLGEEMKTLIFGILTLISFSVFAENEAAPAKKLPKVLLIGDSISKGYTPYVVEMMSKQALVTHNKGNAGPAMRGLENIDEWLAVDEWDVIHFNWGLHDMYLWNYKESDRAPAAYEKRLDTLVQRLKKTGAKLIWATTTPACPGAEKKCKVKIDPATEQQFLEAAMRVMKKHEIQVNDLHAFMASKRGAYSIADNDVHYTQEGSQKLAEQVAAAIRPLLNAESPIEATISRNIVGYELYQASKTFSVNTGSVKVKPFNDLGWHLVIIPGKDASESKVTLKVEGAATLEGYTFSPWKPRYNYWKANGDSIEVDIMPEGWGWYFLRKPLPLSTLKRNDPEHMIVTKETVVEKAKFPVVDIHTHVALYDRDPKEYLKILDETGVAVIVDSPMASFGQTTEDGYQMLEKVYPDRYLTFGTIDFNSRHQDDFSKEAITKLEADVKTMGIPGVGETHDKGAGVFGHALRPDRRGPVHINDERFMPLWRAAARLKLPVLLHISEPFGNYVKFEEHPNARWGRVSRKYSLWGTRVLSHAEMMERRNSLMDEIPDLILIGAHMGSLESDLAELGKTLDKYPNFYVEIGQRHTWFGQQPNLARKFFTKYQDRILFGQDGTKTVAEYRLHFRFLETDDDLIVFSKNRPPVYGLNLPDEVLKKVYYGNAAKLMPRVKKALQNQYPDLTFP